MSKRLVLKSLLGATLALGLVFGAQAQDALARTKASGVLKIGTETAFAPFDFIQEGTHTGLNSELMNEVAKEMGVKVEWTTLPWEGVLPGLEAKKFDMVTLLTGTLREYCIIVCVQCVVVSARTGDLCRPRRPCVLQLLLYLFIDIVL